jgi:hypothetical protein
MKETLLGNKAKEHEIPCCAYAALALESEQLVKGAFTRGKVLNCSIFQNGEI